MPFNSLYSK